MESQHRRMAIKPLLFSVVSFILLAFPAIAAELNTEFPGSDKIVEGKDYFGNYLVAFYQFFISAIAIMAVVVIMFAGFRWMTAQGNQERVSKARETLTGAVVGVVLALMSWVILNFIDPNLIHLKLPDIESFATPADVQPATVCTADESKKFVNPVRGDGERITNTPDCGQIYKYSMNGKEKYCHGWEADKEEGACYFIQDTLTELADKNAGPAHYIGTEIPELGKAQLDAMGWLGGDQESGTSSIDIDCSGINGDCSDDEKECGWIWWQDMFSIAGDGEYKMGVSCPYEQGTSKRCVLVEPLKFFTENGPKSDDKGEGYIANNGDGTGAYCIK